MGKTGGTQQPARRKTSGFKVGDTVRCVHAHSPWYSAGKTYQVVDHPKTLLPAVEASDGFYDEMCLILSKFERVET